MAEEKLDGVFPLGGTDNLDRKLDVIFVHGLGGDAFTTWGPSKDSDTFWPNWLVEDFTEKIGVWTIGYGATPSGWITDEMPMEERAKLIVNQLSHEKIGEKPILFITHSMGGLITKHILDFANCHTNLHYQIIIDNTVGVVFLAVPHAGKSFTHFIRIAKYLLKGNEFIAQLKKNHSSLSRLSDSFKEIVKSKPLKCYSFYETKKLKIYFFKYFWYSTLVVDKSSAEGTFEQDTPIGLNDDHCSICKLELRSDDLYKNVINIINDYLINSATESSSVASINGVVGLHSWMPFEETAKNYALEPEEANKLLKQRNEQTNRLITRYNNDDLLTNDHFSIAYATFRMFDDMPAKCTTLKKLNEKYQVDEKMGPFYAETAKNFRRQTAKDPDSGSCIRICDYSNDDKIIICEADYMDQYVTVQKEISDIKLSEVASQGNWQAGSRSNKCIRDLSANNNALLFFSDSPLPNTLGAAMSIVTSDGYLLMPRRYNVNFQQGFDGCSVSGVLTWDQKLTEEGFYNDIHIFLSKSRAVIELNLNVPVENIVGLALARELERCGKPQYFAHAWIDKSMEELRVDWSNWKPRDNGSSAIKWIRLFDNTKMDNPEVVVTNMREKLLDLIKDNVLLNAPNGQKIVLSEECRASLFYLERYMEKQGSNAFPSRWHNS